MRLFKALKQDANLRRSCARMQAWQDTPPPPGRCDREDLFVNWWAASSCVGVVHRLTPASTFRTVLIACATLLECKPVEKCPGNLYHAVPRTPRVAARSKRATRIRKARVTDSVLTTQDLLLPRVARGDQAATRECIKRFGGLIWSIAKRLMIPDAQIDDAVQDVFVEIWKNAGRYDVTIASETAFVAVIARRRLIDQIRRLNRQTDSTAMSDAVEADAVAGGWRGRGEGASVSSAQETSEEAVEAAKALDQLSVDQQRVLRLSIYRGLSHELIARVLNMPLGTVKTHARRGLIRLREILTTNAATQGAGGAASRVLRDLLMGGVA